ILLILLASLPALFYGAVELWTTLIFFYLSLAVFVLSLLLHPPNQAPSSVKLLFLLSSFPLVIATLQSIPFSIRIVETLSPTAASLYRSADVTLSSPFSLSRHNTITFIFQYGAAFLSFWATTFFVRGRRTSLAILSAISLSAAGYTLYGFLSALLWRSSSTMPNIRSTFVGYTHFAAFAGIGLLSALSLLFANLSIQSQKNWHSLFSSTPDSRFHIKLLLLFLSVLLALGVLFSVSRGAIIAASAASITFFVLSKTPSELKWQRRIILLSLVAGFTALALYFGIEPVILRYKMTFETPDSRTLAWATAIKAFSLYPLTGCGFYAFKYAFSPLKTDPRLYGTWEEAHNDYINFLVEGGLPTLILIILLLFIYAKSISSMLSSERRHIRYTAAAALSACLFVGLQSLGDFQLHIPAVAISFAILLGCALGLNISRKMRSTTSPSPNRPYRKWILFSTILSLSFFLALLSYPFLSADILLKKATPLYKEGEEEKNKEKLNEAKRLLSSSVSLNPLCGEAHFRLARICSLLGEEETALRSFVKAIHTTPAEPRYRYHYALLVGRMGDEERAISLLKDSIKLDPTYAELHFEIGRRLLILYERKKDERLLNDSLASLKRVLEIHKGRLPDTLDVVAKYLPQRKYLKAVIPQELSYYLGYCEYLIQKGKFLWAGYEAEWALSNFSPSEENQDLLSRMHYLLGVAYLNSGREEKALNHFRNYAESFSNKYQAIQDIQTAFQRYGKWWEALDFWSSFFLEEYAYRIKLNEARALVNLGKYRQAWDRLKMMGIESDIETNELMYLCAIGEGRPTMALEYLAMLRHLQPNNIRYILQSAQILYSTGRKTDALRAVEEALRIQPDNPEALHLRSRLKEELFNRPR
ncbi:MAG: O-antigen ligase family protein, partial [Planctomycetota bacterium]|nr:O-antigen ligase family protein [Planctomycetota bacterium]